METQALIWECSQTVEKLTYLLRPVTCKLSIKNANSSSAVKFINQKNCFVSFFFEKNVFDVFQARPWTLINCLNDGNSYWLVEQVQLRVHVKLYTCWLILESRLAMNGVN